MKLHAIDLPNVPYTQPYSIYNKVILLALTLIALTSFPLYMNQSSTTPLTFPKPSSITKTNNATNVLETNSTIGLQSILASTTIKANSTIGLEEQCQLFSGNWIPYPDGPAYYTNYSCKWIIPQQNCMKYGRPETDFMKWRWKPDGCELPLFDAAEFLEMFRGKSLAFVGDSVGRN